MLRLVSPAKINWHLEVLGRQPDGYHQLRTLFQTIDLADEIEIEIDPAGEDLELRVEGESRLAADPTNLAWRAADLFRARYGIAGGVRLGLRKRIPIGGGLGGGSSNAATVLAGLARLHGLEPTDPSLLELARALGADVAFFLFGGVAAATGRGDEIRPLDDARTERAPLHLAIPPFAVPTREVFAAHRVTARRPVAPELERAFAGDLPFDLARLDTWNDLEATCFALFPELGAVYNLLQVSGASWVRLSGSGGTICARFPEARAADAAGEALPSGFSWLPARPLRRGDWRAMVGW